MSRSVTIPLRAPASQAGKAALNFLMVLKNSSGRHTMRFCTSMHRGLASHIFPHMPHLTLSKSKSKSNIYILIENSEWPRLNHRKEEKRRIEVMGFLPFCWGVRHSEILKNNFGKQRWTQQGSKAKSRLPIISIADL